jgi:hypothetical protein
MKKIHLKELGLSLLTTFFFGCVFGQPNEVAVSKPSTTGKSTLTSISNAEAKKPGPAINAKVSRSFLENFKTAQSLVWNESAEGYIASFSFEGRQVLAWFNQSGRLDCTIYYGSGNDLPLQERKLVQSNFPDYEITATQEIDYRMTHVWIVTIRNCKNIKKLRLLDDSLDVIEHITRSE